MNNAPYVLDTSVLTQAARSYYAFDLVPSFWTIIRQHAHNGNVLSIDRVKDEIDQGKDQLKNWATGSFHFAFASSDDPDVLAAYAQVIQWAMAQLQYTDAAKAEFARNENADAWVVAYAKAKGYGVVTQEQSAPNSKAIIKLPDVCRAMDVSCIDTFQMMRNLGITL